MRRFASPRLQFLDQRLQPFGSQPHLHAIGREVDPLDQQPDDPRLLGREQLIPHRREVGDGLDDVALRDCNVARAAAHVRAMISGVRSRCRTCATTASSTSAAGTLRTGHSE